MSAKQAEIFSSLLFAAWLILKLSTFLFTDLLPLFRWPLHLLFFAAWAFYLFSLFLRIRKRASHG